MSENSKIVTTISPNQSTAHYWREVFRFRGLMYYLAWRDVIVRYKQTVLGVLWSLIRPFLTMVVFTVIFGKVAKLPSGDLPYPVLVMAGLLPWQLFAASISGIGESLIANANLISKVYFPRIIAPMSAIVVGLVDFIISLVLMLGILVYYGIYPSWEFLTLPFFVALALMPAFGLGVLLATLNVKYRDFRYIIPFIVQIGFFISPVGFNAGLVPEEWRMLYSINPMVGVIDGFRWALSGGAFDIYMPGFILSIVLSLVSVVFGVWYFRRRENYFADVI